MADVAQQIRDLQAVGHIGPLRLDEGRALWIEPLFFGAARLHIGRPGPDGAPEDGGYDDSWDYRTLAGAMRAAAWWMIDPTAPEPTGWYRHRPPAALARLRGDGDAGS